MFEEIPLEAGIVVPLRPLAEFVAHEQQLLSWVAEHETVEKAQVCEFLPVVARHLANHGAFAIDDFVMREGQNKIFSEGVDQAEGDFVLMVGAKHRILRGVIQHIVHPAHVPLETEAKSAEVDGTGYLRPGSGFLRDHHRVRVCTIDMFVQSAQKMNRVQVFFSAEAVGYPLSFAATVVEIQHRGNGVDSKAVNMILVHPKQRIADEKILDFVAAVVEDKSVPVRMLALPGIFVFVEMRAVEVTQARFVFWKMRGNPIQNYADSSLVKIVDEIHEVVGRSEPAGGGEIAEGFVSPGTVEGVLHDGEKFDMCEASVVDVIGEERG